MQYKAWDQSNDLPEGTLVDITNPADTAYSPESERGWVAVGEYSQDGDVCRLDKAKIIRCWGTTKGIGELVDGPTPKTVLDPAGTLQFHALTVVARIAANAAAWEKAL